MGFIDSYKHLEKLCGEILNDDRRVSAYIDEMLNTPRGSFYVRTWDDDLKKLKHYRWVRNQISHEPGCSESNMCKPEDELWLNNFYYRILNQTDPLSLYDKAYSSTARRKRIRPQTQEPHSYKPPIYSNNHPSPQNDRSYIGLFILSLILLVAIVLLVTKL